VEAPDLGGWSQMPEKHPSMKKRRIAELERENRELRRA
jgi:hypothetical protein